MNKIKQTLLAVFLGRGLMAMRQILIVPILISKWGKDYYGNWLILSALPTFLAMSNLGLGTSAANKIALSDNPDSIENKEIVATSWLMIAAMGIVIILSTYCYQIWFPGKSSLPDHSLIMVHLLACLFVRMLAQPIHGWWVANGKASKSLQINNIYSVGELVGYLTIPLVGGKAPALTAGVLIWSICWLAFYLAQSLRSGCKILSIKGFSFGNAIGLLKIGIGHQLNPLWQGILYQGSIMVAGNILGPAGAALWGSLRIINRAGNQSLELVSQTVGPEFQNNYAQGNQLANQKLHARSLLLSLFLATSFCIGLLLFGPYFFKKWTHGAFNEPHLVWIIMPLSLIPFSAWWVSGEFQRSLNHPWYFNIVGVGCSIVAVATMYLLAPIGIVGLSYGALIFECLMTLLILPKSVMISGENLTSFFKRCRSEITGLGGLVFKKARLL